MVTNHASASSIWKGAPGTALAVSIAIFVSVVVAVTWVVSGGAKAPGVLPATFIAVLAMQAIAEVRLLRRPEGRSFDCLATTFAGCGGLVTGSLISAAWLRSPYMPGGTMHGRPGWILGLAFLSVAVLPPLLGTVAAVVRSRIPSPDRRPTAWILFGLCAGVLAFVALRDLDRVPADRFPGSLVEIASVPSCIDAPEPRTVPMGGEFSLELACWPTTRSVGVEGTSYEESFSRFAPLVISANAERDIYVVDQPRHRSPYSRRRSMSWDQHGVTKQLSPSGLSDRVGLPRSWLWVAALYLSIAGIALAADAWLRRRAIAIAGGEELEMGDDGRLRRADDGPIVVEGSKALPVGPVVLLEPPTRAAGYRGLASIDLRRVRAGTRASLLLRVRIFRGLCGRMLAISIVASLAIAVLAVTNGLG